MESRLIHNILDNVPGVLSVDVMVVTKMVSVHHEPAAISPAALVAALNSAGLQASLNRHSTAGGSEPAGAAKGGMCSSGCCGTGPHAHSSWPQPRTLQQRRGLSWLLAALRGSPTLPPVCVLLSALLLLVNLVLLVPGLGAPHILQKGLLALIAAAVAVPPVLTKAWNGLKNKNLDMNSLVSILLRRCFFQQLPLVVLVCPRRLGEGVLFHLSMDTLQPLLGAALCTTSSALSRVATDCLFYGWGWARVAHAFR